MTTYRVHPTQPTLIYRGELYIGVMFTAEDAALAVEALNGAAVPPGPCASRLESAVLGPGILASQPIWCDLRHGHDGDHNSGSTRWKDRAADRIAEHQANVAARRRSLFSQPHSWTPNCGETCDHDAEPADSCTCVQALGRSVPECPVHQGRRARGPKPPPLGPGCICDGSGRTCPRHGAVS